MALSACRREDENRQLWRLLWDRNEGVLGGPMTVITASHRGLEGSAKWLGLLGRDGLLQRLDIVLNIVLEGLGIRASSRRRLG